MALLYDCAMNLFLFLSYVIVTSCGYWLCYLNLRHLKQYGGEVPPCFEGAIDVSVLRKTSEYTLAQSRVGLVESIIDNILLLIFLFGGLLPVYDRFITSLTDSFILKGVLFFLLLTVAQEIIAIPFSLYRTFRLENHYGFNTMTRRLWLTDFLKNNALSMTILVLVTSGALAIIRMSPQFWWLWVWGFFAVITLFLMYISPYVIEPLFFKFEPVKTEGLEDEIRSLMQKAGLTVSRVMQVDASRRSRHSNAYFTGIGKVKRIVLFDTLMEQMNHREILAVLAHEVGHWKKGHIWKGLVVMEAGSLVVAYIAYRLFAWGGLPGLMGMPGASFAAQLVILAFLMSIVSFPFTPLSSWFSRRHERQADRFACSMIESPHDLADALVKLSRENLANLHPHPLYARFYYSHPPIVERVESLRKASGKPHNLVDHGVL